MRIKNYTILSKQPQHNDIIKKNECDKQITKTVRKTIIIVGQ